MTYVGLITAAVEDREITHDRGSRILKATRVIRLAKMLRDVLEGPLWLTHADRGTGALASHDMVPMDATAAGSKSAGA